MGKYDSRIIKILSPESVSSVGSPSITFRGYECVEIYLHSFVRLYGLLLAFKDRDDFINCRRLAVWDVSTWPYNCVTDK